MQKPDTARLRADVRRQDVNGESWGVVADVRKIVINELCDYIDGFPDYDGLAALVDGQVRAANGGSKVTLAQVREFVATMPAEVCTHMLALDRQKILNFIDNGPKPKTAEEIVTDELRDIGGGKPSVVAEYVVGALRSAGLLKE